MTGASSHLRDDQLLLYATEELPAEYEETRPSELAAAHLQSCDQCKARLRQLHNGLNEFTEAHRAALDAALPSAAGPRALLKAQLADLSARKNSRRPSWLAPLTFAGLRRGVVFASLVLVMMLLLTRVWHGRQTARNLDVAPLPVEPIAQFTPGAVVAITPDQVCSEAAEISTAVPAELKTRVLQLYGIANGQENAYEVDYLITPELGGATDIRNLWPQPYGHTVWNARVKDQLETRLQQLVCHGNLDLTTAQRDLSTDWIAAYRKYFHADMPVAGGST
jgi:hypothetical protein